MIGVWTDGARAGVLDRLGRSGATFAYDPHADSARAVSLTMPVRVQSWDWPPGLHPLFEMNLPEGALRERLVRAFAKATGRFDAFDLLAVVGRSLLGRVRTTGQGEDLADDTPFQSIDEILRARRSGELFDFLLERFARFSGLSGVQPKVLVRDPAALGRASAGKGRRSTTVSGATHIVKLWDPAEFPELAANEHFCLRAAALAGLETPAFELSDDGAALVVERFDLGERGYLGFEDFCVLNGLSSADKYAGGYETRLFKRAASFLDPALSHAAMDALFAQIVLCVALRNGDAHLKNFGVLYAAVDGAVRLAPAYDLITTVVYLPVDKLALTLEGSTNWPDRARLERLGRVRAGLPPSRIHEIFERTADALSAAMREARPWFAQSSAPHVGDGMRAAWESGVRDSLGLVRGLVAAPVDALAAVVEHLRASGGSFDGTVAALARAIGLSPSTVASAVRRGAARGQLARAGRRISLR